MRPVEGEALDGSLGPHDLVITSSTLGHPPWPELVAAAAGAGIRGLSLWPGPDFGRAVDSGMSVAEMRAVLDDGGVVVNDVDAMVQWVGPDDPGPPYFEEPPRPLLYEAAEALGARFANCLLVGPRGTPLDEVAAAFARVCDEAAEHGLAVTVEFGSGTHTPDVATARSVVETAGRTNGGVLVDTWHLHLGRSTLDDLAAVPGPLVTAVQMNDGPAERPADFAHATRYARLAPGDGEFDLAAFVRTLDAIGAPAPLGIEVFNAPLLAELGPGALARRLARSVRALRP
jgi:sugar phosphate isomerase/epimerase